ncbi:SH3 domain-containing protein [Salinimicrobium oceani]|uniref:SH3 domain-containing protein n=1 Tax=Salinimicrobium oceani TaxID=2722702 RepID=UPI00293B9152|nr:SH3 domain-containing protein [Salinimicrobium oceani]
MYKGYRGAQNPLPYVHEPPKHQETPAGLTSQLLVATGTANLRKGPSTRAEIAFKVKAEDTLEVLGETTDWYHARIADGNFFIHKSLARPL